MPTSPRHKSQKTTPGTNEPQAETSPGGDEEAASTGRARIDVRDLLLRALMAFPDFLRESRPLSEAEVTEELACLMNMAATDVKKSAVREAIIGLLEAGYIKREPGGGVCRDELNASNRLWQLYALRLHIERAAWRRIIQKDRESKKDVISELNRCVLSEEPYVVVDETREPIKAVEWYIESVKLHVALVTLSGQPDLARLLKPIIYFVRIGSRMPLETQEERNAAWEEHRAFDKKIRENENWTEKLEEELQSHLQASMKRAIKSLGSAPFSDDELWSNVVHHFPCFASYTECPAMKR